MTTFRRRTAVAALLLVPALSACSFQTDQVYQPGVGANDRADAVNVLNSVVVSAEDGKGVYAGSLVNTDRDAADTLVSISVDGTPQPAKVQIPADGLVNFAAEKKPLLLTSDSIKAGGYVDLELSFKSGQTTTVHTPVVTNSREFADITIPGAKPKANDAATEEEEAAN